MRGARHTNGSALVVAIWVVGLLSMMIITMAFDAHIESRLTSYYRKRTKATYLARSGMDLARLILNKRSEVTGGEPTEEQLEDRWFEHARSLKQGALRGLVTEMGEGTITLDIVPEPARRNVNNLDLANNRNYEEVERNLEQILTVGGITEDTGLWPVLIDSFIDWIDPDDEPRTDGAEADYYDALTPPYKAANRPLDTVEELLLVRGFNRTILFGGVLESDSIFEKDEPRRISGIADLLTTYGDGRVNPNSASQRVLMTLPDVDEVIAGYIIEERQGFTRSDGRKDERPFENDEEFLSRVPELNVPVLRKYITTAESQVARITSTGTVQGVSRTVWCIGEFSGGNIRILSWREEE